MLDLLDPTRVWGERATRRQVLSAATVGAVAGTLGAQTALARDRRSPTAVPAGKARHVIHLYLHGGAATQDMFDLKPHAPAEVRGEFQPIDTNVPGIQICEHLPKMARWINRCAIVRSVHHQAGCHNCLPSFTGSEQPVDINEPVPRDTYPPGMGAVCELLKPPQIDLPYYVALPTYLGWGFVLKRPGPWAGFLGPRYDPVFSEYQPVQEGEPPAGRQPVWMGMPTLAAAELPSEVTYARLDQRRALLADLNKLAARGGAADGADRTWRRAFGLLTESTLRQAFNLTSEDAALRECYGNHLVGNCALIARRLVEAGVQFVDLYFDGYSYRLNTGYDTYWDTHAKNFVQVKRANLPCFDEIFDALLADLDGRGLLDETLLVVNTDFGRTPRVNASAGRDHWTHCYSVVFAGAGIRGGTICGASDKHAAYVKDRPVSPADVCATVYQCLGIDPAMLIHDRVGRPLAVANGGQPITEIMA